MPARRLYNRDQWLRANPDTQSQSLSEFWAWGSAEGTYSLDI